MAAMCVVPECPGSTRGKQRGEKICFFKPPEDQVLEWSNLVPGNIKLTGNDRLCSRHFEDEDIMKDWVFQIDGEKVTMPRGRWTLKVGAVPRIFGCYKDDYKPRTPRTRAVTKIDSESSKVETPLRKRKPKPTQSLADNSSEEESCAPRKRRSKNPTPVRKKDAKPAKRRRSAVDRSNPLTEKTGLKQDISSSFVDDGSLCSGFLSGTETTPSVNLDEHRVSGVDEPVEKEAFDGNSEGTVSSQISTSPKRQISPKMVVKREKCDKGYWAHDIEARDLPDHSPESVQQVQGNGWDYEGVVVKREMCDCDMQCSLPLEECEHTILRPTTVIFDEETSQPFEGSQHDHEDPPCSPSLIEENGVTPKISVPESIIAPSKISSIDLEEPVFKPSTTQMDTLLILSNPSLSIERGSGIAADVIIIEEEATPRSETQIASPDESSECATSLQDCQENEIPVLDQTCSTSNIDRSKLAIEIPLPEITITPVVVPCSKNGENTREIDSKSMPSDRPDSSLHVDEVAPSVTHGSTISDFPLQIEPVEPHIDIRNTVSVNELQTGVVETTGSKESEKTETSATIFENGAKKIQIEESQYSDAEMDFLGFESDEDEASVEKRKQFLNSSDMAVKSAKIYFDKLQEKWKLTANEAELVDSKIFSGASPQAQPHVDEPTVKKAIEQLKELAPRTSSNRKISKTSNPVNVKPGHHKKKTVMKQVATALEKASKSMIKNDSVRNGMKPGIENSKIPRTTNCGKNASNGIIKNDLVRDGMQSGFEDSKIPRTMNCGRLKNVTISSNPPQRPGKLTRCSENILTVEKVAPSPRQQASHKGFPTVKCGKTSLDRILQAVDATPSLNHQVAHKVPPIKSSLDRILPTVDTNPSLNHQVVHKVPPIKSSLDRILQAVDASTPSQICDPAAEKTSLILKNFKSDGVLALECVVLREQVRRLQKELFLQKQLLVDSEHNASLLQRKLELQSQLPCPKCASFRPVIGKETLI